MLLQVDLSREASNLQQFNYNFRNTLAVDFPVPLYPLVSNEVSADDCLVLMCESVVCGLRPQVTHEQIFKA